MKCFQAFFFFASKPVITLSSWSGVIIYWMLPEHLSQVQLAELIDSLDKEYWEADLYAALQEIRDEVHTHMDITEDLTNKARGSNKCFLTAANGKEIIIFSPPHKIGSDSLRYSLLLSLIMLERRMISFKLKVIFSPFSSCLFPHSCLRSRQYSWMPPSHRWLGHRNQLSYYVTLRWSQSGACPALELLSLLIPFFLPIEYLPVSFVCFRAFCVSEN